MSNVVWQPSQRQQPPLPARCVYIRGLFDRDLNVAEIIEELDTFDCNPVELQWIADNKRGKVRDWAKREIKTAKEDPPS